jgi:hypothetical protein
MIFFGGGVQIVGLRQVSHLYSPALAIGEPISSSRRTIPAITSLQVSENPHPGTSV